jgi:hypothetical protein
MAAYPGLPGDDMAAYTGLCRDDKATANALKGQLSSTQCNTLGKTGGCRRPAGHTRKGDTTRRP